MIRVCATCIDITLHDCNEKKIKSSKQKETAFTYKMWARENLQFNYIHIQTYDEEFREYEKLHLKYTCASTQQKILVFQISIRKLLVYV